MQKYQLLEYRSSEEFDFACNNLSKEGWNPCSPLIVGFDKSGISGDRYVQQWSKFHEETKDKDFNDIVKEVK